MIRSIHRRALGALVSLSLLFAASKSAIADGALLAKGGARPVEARVAVAAGPDRTAVWTSLRLEADAGPIALVVPVPPGASLDTSSDAWFEALEVATAPRIFPPKGVPSTCSGSLNPGEHFHVAGSIGHEVTLAPAETKVLADADAVAAWANSHALSLSAATKAELAALVGSRFLIARFEATGQSVTTRTLRVVMPGAPAALPLALTRADAAADLKVTAWLVGPGRGEITGSKSVDVALAKVAWNAATSESTYEAALMSTLIDAGPSGAALELAGHDSFAVNEPIDGGKASIGSVITTLFERAAGYGDGAPGTDACVAQAAASLASITPVAASCPRADLGVVDGIDTCMEAPAGLTDPATLRCGDGADDLAVALSGLVPADAWLTRQSMVIAKGASGAVWPLSFGPGAKVSAVRTAFSVDMSACEAPDAGASSSSGGMSSSGSSSGSASGGLSGGTSSGGNTDVYVDTSPGCTCSGTADTVDPGPYPSETDPYADTSSDSCSGDTTDTTSDTTTSDDCSGDTTDTASDTTTSSGDSCSSDTSGTGSDTTSSSDGCSSDTSDTTNSGSDNCSGDTSSSPSSDSCGGDTSTSSSGDTSGDWSALQPGKGPSSAPRKGPGSGAALSTHRYVGCAIAVLGGSPGRRSPRMSALTLLGAALLLPLRRAGTKKRLRAAAKKGAK